MKLDEPIYPMCHRCGGHDLARERVEMTDHGKDFFRVVIYWQCVPCRNDRDVEHPCDVLEIFQDGKELVIGWRPDDDNSDGRWLV